MQISYKKQWDTTKYPFEWLAIKKQTVTNHSITEIKNTLEGIKDRITEVEEPITELEDRMM